MGSVDFMEALNFAQACPPSVMWGFLLHFAFHLCLLLDRSFSGSPLSQEVYILLAYSFSKRESLNIQRCWSKKGLFSHGSWFGGVFSNRISGLMFLQETFPTADSKLSEAKWLTDE